MGKRVDDILGIGNADVAIYSKFNELIARHGLNPCTFGAALSFNDLDQKFYLNIIGESRDLAKNTAIYKELGIKDSDEPCLIADTKAAMYDALQKAVEKSPRKRY